MKGVCFPMRNLAPAWLAVILLGLSSFVAAENCTTSNDMDAATKTAMVSAREHYFDLLTRGDANGLRQASIPSLAADFSGIESTVKDNLPALTGAKATPRPAFLLEATGTAPLARAEFFCGVFGSKSKQRKIGLFHLANPPSACMES